MQITRNGIDTGPGPRRLVHGRRVRGHRREPHRTDSRLSASSVHFTPGARTAWHRHPKGQTIYVTEGIGLRPAPRWRDRADPPGRPRVLRAWRDHHAGTAQPPGRFMTHLAMLEVDDEGNPATWGDHVTDEEYAAAPAAAD